MYVCCILLLVTQASSLFTSASPEMTTIETDIEFVKLCALVVFLIRFVSRYICVILVCRLEFRDYYMHAWIISNG